jgi:hypothetical protein
MIAGKEDVFICSECVDLANNTFKDGKELIAGRDFQFVMPTNAGIQVLWLESSARKPGLRLPPE